MHRLKPCTCCEDVARLTAQLNANCLQRDALQIELKAAKAERRLIDQEDARLQELMRQIKKDRAADRAAIRDLNEAVLLYATKRDYVRELQEKHAPAIQRARGRADWEGLE